ncbi:MAG: PAS domain-containing protein [Verrucomicrobiota bacterium]
MPHRSEESFRELELGLEQAERTGQVGSWSWNLDGTTLSWSEGTYRVFGLRREEFVPTPDSFFAAIHPLDRERTKRVIMDALQLQSACEVEFRISRPAGMIRWVRATTRLLTGEGGRALCISGTLQDVTEEHRLRDQVRLSQRRELLGLLASGIAHDFNNLLTAGFGPVRDTPDEPALSPNGQIPPPGA